MQKTLFEAATSGALDAIGKALDGGARIDEAETGREGWSALMLAAGHGRHEAVALLLERGATVNLAVPRGDYRGWTALMRAAYFGHADIVRLLVKSGADVNLSNEFGGTALMHAAVEGHPAVVRILLAEGALIDFEDKNGLTAMMLAEPSAS